MVSVVDVDRLPGGADLVGHRVDGDDARTLLGGPAAEELAHALGGLGGGQDRRRVAVVEDGVQAADVAGLGRVEQRHRDAAGVEGAEERDEVFEVLRAEDRDAVAGLGDLLQAGADGAVACAEVGPVQIAHDAVALGGEVQEPVGELVSTHLGPLLDVRTRLPLSGNLISPSLRNGLWNPISLSCRSHSRREADSRGSAGRRGVSAEPTARTQTPKIVPGRRRRCHHRSDVHPRPRWL